MTFAALKLIFMLLFSLILMGIITFLWQKKHEREEGLDIPENQKNDAQSAAKTFTNIKNDIINPWIEVAQIISDKGANDTIDSPVAGYGSYYSKGLGCYLDYDFDGALKLFLQAIDQNPRDTKALRFAGLIYLRNQNYTEAIQHLKASLEHSYDSLNDIICWEALAEAYIQIDKFKAAHRYLKKAQALHPIGDSTNFGLGNYFKKLNKFDKALYHYNKAIELRSTPYLEAFYGLFDLYALMKDYNKAIKYQKMLVIEILGDFVTEPQHLEPQKKIELNPLKKITSYALSVDDNNPSLYYDLGRIEYYSLNFKQAHECFSRALSLNPEDYIILVTRALTLAEDNRYAEAQEDLKKAILIKPNDRLAYTILGIIHFKFDNIQTAIDAFQKYHEIFSSEDTVYIDIYDVRAHKNLADCYYKTRQNDLALKHYHKAFLKFKYARRERVTIIPFAQVTYAIAKIYYENKDFDKLRKMIDDIVSLRVSTFFKKPVENIKISEPDSFLPHYLLALFAYEEFEFCKDLDHMKEKQITLKQTIVNDLTTAQSLEPAFEKDFNILLEKLQ